MGTNRKIVAINGSYRQDGVTDCLVDTLTAALEQRGVTVARIDLRDTRIEFCRNCRECMQQAGDAPGHCVIRDDMTEVIEALEAADAYVFAAPTNFGSATAVFKRFMERLAPYGYWPWGAKAPKFRRAKFAKKPAVLVSSSAAPSILGRLAYATLRELRTASKTIGAKPVGTLYAGLVSDSADAKPSPRSLRRAERLAHRLA